ncbi:MAG TPA: glycosyl hydrolase family 18 protein [Chitinophagaceae bacterium]|nr:glycosyl hydrolase family 18 protein [Chitinophagaceae bacterium]
MNRRSFLLIPVFCFSLISAQSPHKKSSFKIVGYYSLNAALAPGQNEPPFDQLTHINLWFLNPDSTGSFTRDLSALIPFVNSAHRKNVKVLFSIGGGSKQNQYHHLLKDDKRPALIDSLVSEVLSYGLDGVDVDLEGSNIDENYEKFVVELAAVLKAHNKLITAAIAIYYKDQLTDKALAQYDFVNVMSYDRTGPWRPEKPGPHSLYQHAVEDLEYFSEIRKIPAERMTLGVPFYGYGYGPEITSPAISMNFREIVTSFPGAELVDEWTMADGKILYYNGIPTMKQKVALAREKASGIMIWQIQGDAEGDKSLLKVINQEGRKKQ